MLILAIDTSTDDASIALARDSTILAEFSWYARGNHSRHLESILGTMLSLVDVAPGDLSAVVAAIGPGSFSGIRVGLSRAMGLAMALSAPLVGISTLDIIALAAAPGGNSVWAAIDAGREQLYAAHYSGLADRWHRDSDYFVLTPAELAARMAPEDAIAGLNVGAVGPHVRTMQGPWNYRRAAFLAELGRRYLAAGGEDQLHTVQPLYLRRSAAEEKRASIRQE